MLVNDLNDLTLEVCFSGPCSLWSKDCWTISESCSGPSEMSRIWTTCTFIKEWSVEDSVLGQRRTQHVQAVCSESKAMILLLIQIISGFVGFVEDPERICHRYRYISMSRLNHIHLIALYGQPDLYPASWFCDLSSSSICIAADTRHPNWMSGCRGFVVMPKS